MSQSTYSAKQLFTGGFNSAFMALMVFFSVEFNEIIIFLDMVVHYDHITKF